MSRAPPTVHRIIGVGGGGGGETNVAWKRGVNFHEQLSGVRSLPKFALCHPVGVKAGKAKRGGLFLHIDPTGNGIALAAALFFVLLLPTKLRAPPPLARRCCPVPCPWSLSHSSESWSHANGPLFFPRIWGRHGRGLRTARSPPAGRRSRYARGYWLIVRRGVTAIDSSFTRFCLD